MNAAHYFYTKLVDFKTLLLIAPSPKANSVPPARHSNTLNIVELRGVIIDTIINRSIPPPKLPQRHTAIPQRITVSTVPEICLVLTVERIHDNMPLAVIKALHGVLRAAGYIYTVFSLFDLKGSLRIAVVLLHYAAGEFSEFID